MASPEEICNLALSHIGVGKEIASLDSEKSQEAMACRRVFEPARIATLRDFGWPFATKFVDLGLVKENPTSEWSFSYQYPSDCLHFRKILSGTRNDNRQSRVPYRIVYGASGQEIYTDCEDAEAEYTVDVKDTGRFPQDFVMALSFRIAFLVAPRLTAGDPFKLGDRARTLYDVEVSRAKATAANEEQEEEDPDSEFIRARS